MRRAAILVAAFVVLGEALASADSSPAALPNVTLSVTPGTAGGPWKLVVTNAGDLPVRIAADPRLVTLDLFPQDPTPKLMSVRCALPSDARPPGDEGRELVIPAKRSWSMSFDPLYYCFGARERALLTTGTTVKPRLGWPAPLTPKKAKKGTKAQKPTTPSAPFVVSPVGAAVGKLMPAKEIEGSSFTLTEPVTVAPPPSSAAAASGTNDTDTPPMKPPLSIRATQAIDVGRGTDIPITVTLLNHSDRAVTTFFRPSTMAFTVNGPAGSVSCGTPRTMDEPMRDLFVTIRPGQTSASTVLLTAFCPPGTFDEPGIYRVVPKLDTSGTSGRNVGLRTWDGETSATIPSLVRVRIARKPLAANKPQLD